MRTPRYVKPPTGVALKILDECNVDSTAWLAALNAAARGPLDFVMDIHGEYIVLVAGKPSPAIKTLSAQLGGADRAIVVLASCGAATNAVGLQAAQAHL